MLKSAKALVDRGLAASMPDKDPQLVIDVELALRKSGFWITSRNWLPDGCCILRFKGIQTPFCHFKLSHELLIESAAMLDAGQPAEYQGSIAQIEAFIAANRSTWAPLAKAMLN